MSNARALLDPSRGPLQLLYDVSGTHVQSQEVVRAIVVSAPKTSAFALIDAGAIAGQQLKRIFTGVEVFICENELKALTWLSSESVIQSPT